MTLKNSPSASEVPLFLHLKRRFFINLTTFFIFSLMIGVLFYHGYSIATKQLPLVDATMEVKLEVAVARLIFAKNSTNNSSPAQIKEAWLHLDEVDWYINAMLFGGSNQEGMFYPISKQKIREELILVGRLFEKLKVLFIQRYGSTAIQQTQSSVINLKIEQAYDEFFVATDNIETLIQKQIDKELQQHWLLGSLLFIASLLMGFILSFFIYQQEKNRNILIKLLGSNEARMKGLVNTLPDLIWLKSADGIYLNCNSKFENLFGHKESEIIGKTDYDFVSNDEAEFFRKNDKAAEALGKPRMNEELLTFSYDGHKEWTETIKAPMYEKNGKFIGILGIGRDITERKKIQDQIKFQATHDGLTGLLNRVEAEKSFARELDRSIRYSHSLSLFMVDIDFFKSINDTYGHSLGDKVLQEFSYNLEENMRTSDINSRFGGEEFVVILPETIPSQAIALAERLRKSIQNMVISEDGIKVNITASIGVASYPENGNDFSEILQKADTAMYKAKDQGRNRVKVY